MNSQVKNVVLDSYDIDIIEYVVDTYASSDLQSYGIIASDDISDPVQPIIESIKYKIQNPETASRFFPDETLLIYESLMAFKGQLNVDKAHAKKGTALYKRTQRDSKHLNKLLSFFMPVEITTEVFLDD